LLNLHSPKTSLWNRRVWVDFPIACSKTNVNGHLCCFLSLLHEQERQHERRDSQNCHHSLSFFGRFTTAHRHISTVATTSIAA
jgi:hypothetical protein